jgi:hypothetical protein
MHVPHEGFSFTDIAIDMIKQSDNFNGTMTLVFKDGKVIQIESRKDKEPAHDPQTTT